MKISFPWYGDNLGDLAAKIPSLANTGASYGLLRIDSKIDLAKLARAVESAGADGKYTLDEGLEIAGALGVLPPNIVTKLAILAPMIKSAAADGKFTLFEILSILVVLNG